MKAYRLIIRCIVRKLRGRGSNPSGDGLLHGLRPLNLRTGTGDIMRLARCNVGPRKDADRVRESRIEKWRAYYRAAEAKIEAWGDKTTDGAVVAFKHQRGYSHRRRLAAWLPSVQADGILSEGRAG